MRDEMTASQFEDWYTAYQVDPWGDKRADLRMQRVAWASSALQNRDMSKVRETDFAFKLQSAQKPISAAEYKRRCLLRYGLFDVVEAEYAEKPS